MLMWEPFSCVTDGVLCNAGRHRVNTIKLTTHPFFPVRAVLMCRDSSVRIISPPAGEVLTTLVMPPYTGLIDAAYAIAESEWVGS